jgi:hypothetical protein
VSRNTVNTQTKAIYRKLGVTSRSDAVKAGAAANLWAFLLAIDRRPVRTWLPTGAFRAPLLVSTSSPAARNAPRPL